MRLAPEGRIIVLPLFVFTAVSIWQYDTLGIPMTIPWILFGLLVFCFNFFRDPIRNIPEGENMILAPADGKIVKIQIETHGTNVTWDTRNGDTIDASGPIINISSGNPADKNNIALMGNPTASANNWEYQTFGAWMTDRSKPDSRFGSLSMGAQTAGSAIPKTASATFTGSAGGIYIDSSAKDYTVSSAMTMVADFANRTMDFRTSGTKITNIDTMSTMAAANLDMTGNLTYAAGKNKFIGNVLATGLSGTTTGHFYGPTAEEVGGVFNLTGAAGEIYSGSYGAKR
jgi:hypothetical protein